MKIALIGNQNSGKTTLFNLLTGSNQKIGNWPGVTIERKSGIIKGTDFELNDLPGIYSLSPYTSEEAVSRNYILNEKPDLIVNIVDATSIERSLYLTTQLMELDCGVILALNMADMLEKKGLFVDEKAIEEQLNLKVVRISALKKTGIDELIDAIKAYDGKKGVVKTYPEPIETEIAKVGLALSDKTNVRFTAVKMLERDLLYKEFVDQKVMASIDALEKLYDMDTEQLIANYRYDFVVKVVEKAVVRHKVGATVTQKLDKVFLNKWAALPIFALIMCAIYFLAVGFVGSFTVDFIGDCVSRLGELVGKGLTNIGASEWSVSLVRDGIIAGVGAVLGFVPQLLILFLCISILETSGYMSRIAFMLDKVFKKFGLSGKSLIPFIVGSGCSVPGIMTARTVEDESERNATVVLTPFIPCSAKLPIITLFTGSFFGSYGWLAAASMYLLAIAIILVTAVCLKKFYFKGSSSSFISELPEYKLPSPRYVLRDVVEKTAAFIKRAGTIILLCSVVIWFLLSFGWNFKYGVNIEDSILASIGNCLAWLFYPILGEWSWAATVSAIQGLVAKEQVVSSMAVIAGLAEDASGASILNAAIYSFFTPASALGFMVFNLFSAPCIGAIGAMRRELGSTKAMFKAVGLQTAIAWVLAVIISGIGNLILLL